MKITDYNASEHGDVVTKLFATIYPNWKTEACQRMAYHEHHRLHILTRLATEKGALFGQLNVFRIGEACELGNIGYHVHPDWQRRGVATALLAAAWPLVADLFDDGLMIQTTEDNTASVALARKAGFKDAPQVLMRKYAKHLKSLRVAGGICLHYPKSNKKQNPLFKLQ